MIKDDLFTKEIRVTDKESTYVIKTSGFCSGVFPGGSVRGIGKFIKNGDIIEYHCIRNNPKHLMRKLNAYGMSEFIWREIQPDLIIFEVTDTKKRFSISYEDSKKVVKYLTFKDQGFETQIFIPLESLNEISLKNKIIRPGIIKANPTVFKKPTVETPSLF